MRVLSRVNTTGVCRLRFIPIARCPHGPPSGPPSVHGPHTRSLIASPSPLVRIRSIAYSFRHSPLAPRRLLASSSSSCLHVNVFAPPHTRGTPFPLAHHHAFDFDPSLCSSSRSVAVLLPSSIHCAPPHAHSLSPCSPLFLLRHVRRYCWPTTQAGLVTMDDPVLAACVRPTLVDEGSVGAQLRIDTLRPILADAGGKITACCFHRPKVVHHAMR